MAAIPAVIGLAAVGVDAGIRWSVSKQPVKTSIWNRPWLRCSSETVVRLATVLLLLIGLRNLQRAADHWLVLTKVDPEQIACILDAVSTDELAWVSPTLGNWDTQMLSYDHGLKLTDGWRLWDVKGFELAPSPYIAYRFDGEYLPEEMELYSQTPFGLIYHSLKPNQYATSSTGGSCSAHGEGGSVSVTCNVPEAGMLIVQESAMDGWTATNDGRSVDVTNGDP